MYAGLGSEVNDICGRDWTFEGGDHGDPGNKLCEFVLLLSGGYGLATLIKLNLIK